MVGLLAMLTLGLGEPLLCILHCQVWLPSVYHGYFAPHDQASQHAQHAHQGHHAMNPAAPVVAASDGGPALEPRRAAAIDQGCVMPHAAGDQSGVPFHVPPSPIHDVLPIVLIFSIAMLAVYTPPATRPGGPPQHAWPPPLRPPIRFAD